MKRSILLVISAICFLSACSSANTQESIVQVQVITAAQAKERMEQGGVTVVDVRLPEEYQTGHVPSAVNIPNEEIGSEEIALLPDKSQPLLVYCRSGRRSAQAAEKLAALGYEEVYDFGGILDWEYEIEK